MSGRIYRDGMVAAIVAAAAMTTPAEPYELPCIGRKLAHRNPPKKRPADPSKKAARKRQKKARATRKRGAK